MPWQLLNQNLSHNMLQDQMSSATFPTNSLIRNPEQIFFKFEAFLVLFRPELHTKLNFYQLRFNINKNCHNSRTSDGIDKKHWPVTKLNKRNTSMSKKWRWRRVSKLQRFCHFPDFWPIWSNLQARFRTHGLSIVLNSLLSNKHWKRRF